MRTESKQHSRKRIDSSLHISRYYSKVYPVVLRYVQNHGGHETDAEDIMQEAIVQMIQNLTIKNRTIGSNAEGYLFGICRNLWNTELRYRKKMRLQELKEQQVKVTEASTDTSTIYEDQHLLFKSYFGRLHENTRKLWQLWFEGNSIPEIANELGYTEGYVRKKKSESKKRLTDWIQADARYGELVGV